MRAFESPADLYPRHRFAVRPHVEGETKRIGEDQACPHPDPRGVGQAQGAHRVRPPLDGGACGEARAEPAVGLPAPAAAREARLRRAQAVGGQVRGEAHRRRTGHRPRILLEPQGRAGWQTERDEVRRQGLPGAGRGRLLHRARGLQVPTREGSGIRPLPRHAQPEAGERRSRPSRRGSSEGSMACG